MKQLRTEDKIISNVKRIHMIGIGEETGSLEEMLMNCARYYDEETELATQQIMSLMEPMIIIVMAGIVCLILIKKRLII